MKKSNWREELNAPKSVRKYALNELALTLGGLGLAKWLLGGGLAATAGIAYANRNRISQTFSNMFNRKETIDDLDKLDNFWRNYTKTNNTNIADPIGKDVINPGALDTKTDNQTTFLPLLNKTRTNLKTRTRTRKPFNFKKLPKLPGTAHNVGKRVNPQ